MKDIFDTENIDDLPDSLKKQLRKKKKSFRQEIVDLFLEASGRPLTIKMLMVSYYRKHNIIVDRKRMNATVYQMTKSRIPILKPTLSPGEFILIDGVKNDWK